MGTGIHLYQMTCWESPTKKWHVNDIKNLGGKSGKWYVPMRILNLSIDEYVNLLIEKGAKGLHYYEPTDYLGFYFSTEKEAKAFCSYVNKVARQCNYYCA